MTNPHGSFIWYELMTKDVEAAKRFYDHVVGWTVGPPPECGMDYRMIAAPDGQIGGVLPLSDEMCANGARPCWLGYIGVDDVDAAVANVEAAGGKTLMPAWDIPGIGRIAMVADPQGLPFYVMRGASEESSTAFSRTDIGHISWNELVTTDAEAALAFYGEQFGFAKDGGMPMGELGEYSFISHGGQGIGAIMNTPPGGHPGWGFYFRVPEIEAARARVEESGGKVLFGPMEVPTGEMVLNAADPEGVPFGLVAPPPAK